MDDRFKFHHMPAPKPFGETLLQDVFPSELDSMYKTAQKILDVLGGRRLVEGMEDEFKIRLCLDEALVNAVKHGNKFDVNKVVRVTLCADLQKWGVLIKDEGQGFTPADLPDYESEEALLDDHGRGVLLINEFMDEVKYYDKGSAIFMVRMISRKDQSGGSECQMEN